MKKKDNYFDNKTVLITGGTGSFGKAFLGELIKKYKNIKKIIIFSRDELKQFDLEKKYPSKKYPKIRFFLGDIRDKDRLFRALDNVDIVVHAAALKQVPKAEYDPFEYIKTNVVGAQNLIECCMDKKVANVIALSTDKAVSPINLYGATKLCADKLFLAANNMIGSKNIKFSVVRYGNVVGSRGSVIPYFLNQRTKGFLSITDENMTRFSMELQDSVNMVIWSIKNNKGGEIFIPKLPSYKIVDLARAIDAKCKLINVGIRPGEKINESLISEAEGINCYDIGKYYVVLGASNKKLKIYHDKKYKKVPKNFSYSSGKNHNFLTINQLQKTVIKFQEKISKDK